MTNTFHISHPQAFLTADRDQPETRHRNVFHRNALRYLNVCNRLNRPGLPAPLRARLRQLLADN